MGLKESGLRGSLRNVSVGIDAIPDSVVAQFDATEEPSTGSITSITDLVGDFDLSGDANVISSGIDGKQTFRFDGTVNMSQSTNVSSNEPFGFVGVVQFQGDTSTSDFPSLIDGGSNNELNVSISQNEFVLARGGSNSFVGGDPTNNPVVMSLIGESESSVRLRINGADVNSSEEDAADLTGITLASSGDDSSFSEIDIGEIVVLSAFDDPDLDEEEQRLADKWGITL